jgi:hypothetical protein
MDQDSIWLDATNLVVPPHRFLTDTRIIIGDDAEDTGL